MTQRKIEYWVIPPQADAEYVANMEQVIDVYQKPYAADRSARCAPPLPLMGIGNQHPLLAPHRLVRLITPHGDWEPVPGDDTYRDAEICSLPLMGIGNRSSGSW